MLDEAGLQKRGGGGFCVTSVVLALLAVLRLVMAFVMG